MNEELAKPRKATAARAGLSPRPAGYAECFADVKARVHATQQRAALSVNHELLRLYWQLGRDILDRQARDGWGAGAVSQVAADLRAVFPEMKGFSRAKLMYMRAFAEDWPDPAIVQQPVGQLLGFVTRSVVKLALHASRISTVRCSSRVARNSVSKSAGGAKEPEPTAQAVGLSKERRESPGRGDTPTPQRSAAVVSPLSGLDRPSFDDPRLAPWAQALSRLRRFSGGSEVEHSSARVSGNLLIETAHGTDESGSRQKDNSMTNL